MRKNINQGLQYENSKKQFIVLNLCEGHVVRIAELQ